MWLQNRLTSCITTFLIWGSVFFISLSYSFHCVFSKYYVRVRQHSGKESACQCRRCKRLGFDHWLEQWMATLSNILAWEIPWTDEPGRLHCPWGRKESSMTECTHTDTCEDASGFLGLSTTSTQGWVTPAGDCSLHCRMFSTSLASLHSMPVGALSLAVTSKNVSRHHGHQISPEGPTWPTCRTTGINLTSLDSNADTFLFLSGICEVYKWHCLYWLCGITLKCSYLDFKIQIKIDAV